MDDVHITSVIWCSIWCFLEGSIGLKSQLSQGGGQYLPPGKMQDDLLIITFTQPIENLDIWKVYSHNNIYFSPSKV